MSELSTRLRDEWPSHIGLLVSAAFSGFIVLRLLVFAQFSPTTASGILQVGTANVALASVVTSIPAAASLAYGYLVGRLVVLWPGLAKQDRFVVAALTIFGLFLYLLFMPLLSAILPIAFLVVVISFGRGYQAREASRQRAKAGTPEPASDWQPSAFAMRAFYSVFCIALVMTLAGRPWLPPEQLEHAGGDAYTGYVVGTRGDSTIIKPLGSRLLVQASTDQLSRTYCDLHRASWERTLPDLLGIKTEVYPDCPERDESGPAIGRDGTG